jgi:hypothetical protein
VTTLLRFLNRSSFGVGVVAISAALGPALALIWDLTGKLYDAVAWRALATAAAFALASVAMLLALWLFRGNES